MGIEVLRARYRRVGLRFHGGEGRGRQGPRKVIRFGLSAVKGVGENAVQAIWKRAAEAFGSLWDFASASTANVATKRCSKL